MNPIHANEAQLRAIAVRLSLLDKAICQVEQYAQGRETRSVFCVESNALTPSQREALATEATVVRAVLRRLQAAFRLAVCPRDAAEIVRGQCNGQWVAITELKSRYLRAYGDVAEELAEYLDPKADELLQHLYRMAAICGDSSHVVVPRGKPKP